MDKEKTLAEFRRWIRRPFVSPDKWKVSEPNMSRVRLAACHNKFIIDKDHAATLDGRGGTK